MEQGRPDENNDPEHSIMWYQDHNSGYFHIFKFSNEFMDCRDDDKKFKANVVGKTLVTLYVYKDHRPTPDWPDKNIPVGGEHLDIADFTEPHFETRSEMFVRHVDVVTLARYRSARAALFGLANKRPPKKLFFLDEHPTGAMYKVQPSAFQVR